jgi:hypothetical protein
VGIVTGEVVEVQRYSGKIAAEGGGDVGPIL